MPPPTDLGRAARKRVNAAIGAARKVADGDPGLRETYLRRFHRAMDALETQAEGEAVYDALRDERWYVMASEALKRTKAA